jgi:hypothetical protein
MARALEWGALRPADRGGAFLIVNAGSDEWNYRIRELAEGVASVLPGVDVSIAADGQPDKRSYQVDFSLFRRLAPDHQPLMDLRKTVQELAEGLRAMNFSDERFRESNLIRLRTLAGLISRGLLNERLEWAMSGRHPAAVTAGAAHD